MRDKDKQKRRIFEKRRRLVKDLAEAHLRSIHAFKRNWNSKYENFLLPRAQTVFDYLIRETERTWSMMYSGANRWFKVYEDEERLERKVQAILATLNWIYWQRLEGYEVTDVSAARECSFEDIGGIQQLFIASDALIEDYKSSFSFKIPYDIFSVFGLHHSMQVTFPFFVSAPRYAKYGFFPCWVLFSHEVAHIAVGWIQENYGRWLSIERGLVRRYEMSKRENSKMFKETFRQMREIEEKIRKLDEESKEAKKGKEGEIEGLKREARKKKDELKKMRENSRICYNKLQEYLNSKIEDRGRLIFEEIKSQSDKVFNEMRSFLVSNSIEHKGIKELLGRLRTIDRCEETEEFSRWSDFVSTCGEVLREWDEIVEKNDLNEQSNAIIVNSQVDDLYAQLVDYIEDYKHIMKFAKDFVCLENESFDNKLRDFFEKWRRICLRADGLTELMTRLTSGHTGRRISEERFWNFSEQLICDVIATLLSGEYYIYSFCFFNFFPTVLTSKKGILGQNTRTPMVLRLFVCLETLGHTVPELSESLDSLSKRYLYSRRKYGTKTEKIDKYVDSIECGVVGILGQLFTESKKCMSKRVEPEVYRSQRNMIEELLKEVLDEEELVGEFLAGRKDRLDTENEMINPKERFNYMDSLLQEDLRVLLKLGSPDLGKLEGSGVVKNSLHELIDLIRDNLINAEGCFYNPRKDFEEISKMESLSGRLKKGAIVLDSEQKPRYIISAFCHLYFKERLVGGTPKHDFIKAFNSTVLSIAWSKQALERFSHEKSSAPGSNPGEVH